MIRVAAHIPGLHDATAYYRALTPFAHIRKRLNSKISFEVIPEWSGPAVMQYDVAFFQRPSTASELEAIRIAKRLGLPVIVEYDDLLFGIPTDNPAYRAYMNKATQETIITIMREATCIWVSTKELKRCIQIPGASLNDKVYVIPNAIDDVHLAANHRTLPPPPQKRQPAVVWRGSPTHERDVMEYAIEIAEVANSSPKTSFVFVGYNPWFLTERMAPSQAIVSGPLPIGEFMDFLYNTSSSVGMVPLHDSRFNRCKSNIAWLEMTWSGGVVLAPDWEEWRHPGIVTYRTPEDFKAGLKTLVEMEPEKLAEMNRMSWNHICKHFTLSETNKIRLSTLDACLGGKWPDGYQAIPDEDVAMVLE